MVEVSIARHPGQAGSGPERERTPVLLEIATGAALPALDDPGTAGRAEADPPARR